MTNQELKEKIYQRLKEQSFEVHGDPECAGDVMLRDDVEAVVDTLLATIDTLSNDARSLLKIIEHINNKYPKEIQQLIEEDGNKQD